MQIEILIQLLLAHFLTDFVFQPPKMIKSKNSDAHKSFYFWIHIILSGTLTYVLLMQWSNWQVPLFIIVTHGVIDLWKIRQENKIADNSKKTGTLNFFLDQLFHLIVILIAWLYIIKGFGEIFPFIESLITEKQYITIITAIVLIIGPVGIVIGKITEPFRNEFSSNDSLRKAGTYIGVFERLLVLIFVLMGQYAAIGFLIAAKSVLRISKEDAPDARKKTEYVLIGTLISFTVAIIIGLITQYIISH